VSLLIYEASQGRGKAIPESTGGTRVVMTQAERRTVGALASVYLIRMLGLFLLLPVLAIYASRFPAASPTLIGLALGVYGLTQAALQIPFGRWSDRWERKPVIAIGLVLFVAGSVLGALADSLTALILARALQGGGAISAAVTALLADQTRAIVRTRAMALIGISIGIAFVLSLIAAPLLDTLIGVRGIFWSMALAGLAGIALTCYVVPSERDSWSSGSELRRSRLLDVALSWRLIPLYAAIFTLHFVLTATFLAVPLLLVDEFALPQGVHWRVYLGTFVASLALTVPLILGSERGRRPVRLLVAAMLITVVAQLILAFGWHRWWAVLTALVLFFGVVNFLEAELPALLSRAAPTGDRGAALGVFATGQFTGTFAGGAAGGVLMHLYGVSGVFLGAAAMALCWTVLAPRAELTSSHAPGHELGAAPADDAGGN